MTYLEEYLKAHPDEVTNDVVTWGCPANWFPDFEMPDRCRDSSMQYLCHECWTRQVPLLPEPETENVVNLSRDEITKLHEIVETAMENEKESNNMHPEKMEAAMTINKKTKTQLIEEIEAKNGEIYELKQELEKFEKYAKYDEVADEMFAVKSSFINAGFTDAEAFTLMTELIKTAGVMAK